LKTGKTALKPVPMQPAAAGFEPLFFQPPRQGKSAARLRAARFAADPAVPRRGVCVLLNGQTEFIEKYFEVIDELRRRGFAVATFDWRGQGGSDRLLGDDSRKGYVKDFAEYDEDLAAFMAAIVAPMGEGKPIALAHSMGGHNLLRYLARKPDAVAKAVLTAPMVAVSFRGNAAWLVALVTSLQNRFGRGTGWVWGMEARDPHRMTFSTQMVTSDEARFERAQKILREQPDLRLAGATWAWLAAAMRSMAWVRKQAAHITTPLLVIGAGADQIVVTKETKAFAARLPHARYLEIAGAGHEMLMERDAFRAQWWAAVDAFL
jgi:lysophospholipase